MNYSKSLLLYQDEPAYGWVLKLVMVIVPVLLWAFGIYLWSSGEGSGSLVLLVEGFVVGLLFWAVFPRKYQVFDDYLRIALGGPLGIKIRYNQIKTIEITTRTALTVNYVTRIARTYVVIVKKKGLSVAITPNNNELFVENANRALSQWTKNNQS